MLHGHDTYEGGRDDGKASHTGIAFVAGLALYLVLFLGAIVLLDDGPSKEDIWKAMQSCPPGHTIEVNEDGDFKGCVLTERLTN